MFVCKSGQNAEETVHSVNVPTGKELVCDQRQRAGNTDCALVSANEPPSRAAPTEVVFHFISPPAEQLRLSGLKPPRILS